MKPLVSVLMPVYNSENFLNASINSILCQTFENFEFIIIDDASTDNSLKIIESYKDERIILVKKEINTGYTNSLNLALKIAKGKYIARMDSDDISVPKRFELQFKLMENNPELVICGSAFQIINSNEVIKHPKTHNDILLKLLEGTTFAHPTVFIKKEVFDKYNLLYSPEYEPAEDYYLWTQLVKYGKAENIDDVLLLYRRHDNQVSSTKSDKQFKLANSIRKKYFVNYFNDLTGINYFNDIEYENIDLKRIIEIFNYLKKLLVNKIVKESNLTGTILFEINMLQLYIFSKKEFQNIFTLLYLIKSCPYLFKYNGTRMKFSFFLKSIF
jgi:glycosyltransferase involved in cell wall biosynthesis